MRWLAGVLVIIPKFSVIMAADRQAQNATCGGSLAVGVTTERANFHCDSETRRGSQFQAPGQKLWQW